METETMCIKIKMIIEITSVLGSLIKSIMQTRLWLLCVMLASAISANASTATIAEVKGEVPVYCNPLNLNYQVQHPNNKRNSEIWVREGADPSIAIFKDKYYLFSSMSDGYWQSENLVDWISLKPSSIEKLPGLRRYAPTVVTIGDTLFFKDGNGSNPVYSTQTPEDPDSWKQVSPEGWRRPDAQFFLDDDGKLWINYGCFNDGFLFLQAMDMNDFMPKGESHKFFMPDVKNRGWEGVIAGRRGMDHRDSHGWVEGGQLVKNNGTYYYIYSLPGLNNAYANGVYTSTNILGPYTYQQHNPITQKLTGFSPGSAHGEVFKDRYGNWWTLALSSVWTFDRFERRISLFPTSIDANGTLLSDTRLGDYPTMVPQERRSDPAASLWNGMNLLSVNRPVKASSTATAERPAEAAVDEEIMTFWAAASGNEGEWFEVDLQNVCTVEAVQANFGEYELKTGDEPDAAIRYQVLGSIDGKNWFSIIDKRKNMEDRPHDFTMVQKPVKARYVRLVNTYTPYGGKFALRGLRVFGKGHGAKAAAPEFEVERKGDRRKMEVRWELVEGADGYVVRYGQETDRLYLANQFYNTSSVVISCLENEKEYFITVDAFNQNGYTAGNSIVPVVSAARKAGRYEAEAGELFGGATAGGGLVHGLHRDGAGCVLSVDGGSGGTFELTIAYATALENARSELIVNGKSQNVVFPVTGSWNEIKQVKQTVQLKPGNENRIEIKGRGQGVNLDWLELTAKKK